MPAAHRKLPCQQIHSCPRVSSVGKHLHSVNLNILSHRKVPVLLICNYAALYAGVFIVEQPSVSVWADQALQPELRWA